MSARLIQHEYVQDMLLAAVAAVPEGVKLSIPQLRDALVSQADVLAGLQALVDAGRLDRNTLRPPLSADPIPTNRGSVAPLAPPPPESEAPAKSAGEPLGQATSSPAADDSARALANALVAYSARHGLSTVSVGMHLFGSRTGIARLRVTRRPRAATIGKIRAFLAAPPSDELKKQAAGGARVAENGGVSGAELAAKLDALIAEHGLSPTRVGMAINGNRDGVNAIRRAHPRPATVAKVEAFLADPPLAELKPRKSWSTRRAKAAQQQLPAERVKPSLAPLKPTGERSFEEQLERVARGEVGIAPAFHPRKADPGMTLGGVTGDMAP